jgi:hypothetical protein
MRSDVGDVTRITCEKQVYRYDFHDQLMRLAVVSLASTGEEEEEDYIREITFVAALNNLILNEGGRLQQQSTTVTKTKPGCIGRGNNSLSEGLRFCSGGMFSEQAVVETSHRDGHTRSLGPLTVVLVPGLAISYFSTGKFRDCVTAFWVMQSCQERARNLLTRVRYTAY